MMKEDQRYQCPRRPFISRSGYTWTLSAGRSRPDRGLNNSAWPTCWLPACAPMCPRPNSILLIICRRHPIPRRRQRKMNASEHRPPAVNTHLNRCPQSRPVHYARNILADMLEGLLALSPRAGLTHGSTPFTTICPCPTGTVRRPPPGPLWRTPWMTLPLTTATAVLWV